MDTISAKRERKDYRDVQEIDTTFFSEIHYSKEEKKAIYYALTLARTEKFETGISPSNLPNDFAMPANKNFQELIKEKLYDNEKYFITNILQPVLCQATTQKDLLTKLRRIDFSPIFIMTLPSKHSQGLPIEHVSYYTEDQMIRNMSLLSAISLMIIANNKIYLFPATFLMLKVKTKKLIF